MEICFCFSCEDAENKTWAHPYTGNQFYAGLYSTEVSTLVIFHKVITLMVVAMLRAHDLSKRASILSRFLSRK